MRTISLRETGLTYEETAILLGYGDDSDYEPTDEYGDEVVNALIVMCEEAA